MTAIAAQGSPLPGGFVLGKLAHAERVGLVYEALPGDGHGFRARALVLHPQHAEALQSWFEDYARLIRGLSHPNLLYVHAIGYVDTGLPVVVTEWVEGRTLRSELARGHIFQPAEVLRILRPLASVLDYLHNKPRPVLHRALQPELVMLVGSELSVKLLGVGEADRPLQPPLRPSYLSPEELDGPGPSPASDVFGLASLVYEILTGRMAFPGPAASLLQAVRQGPRPFVALGPNEALAPVDLVLHRAWDPDPQQRPPSATALYAALAAAMERVPAAELTRRRSPLDSPFRARTQPPAPHPVWQENTPRGVAPSGRPPSMPSARSGAHPAVRTLGPGVMPSATPMQGVMAPRTAAAGHSSAPPGPRSQGSMQRVPRARSSNPDSLALAPPPRDLTLLRLAAGPAPDSVRSPEATRVPETSRGPDSIRTEDAEISLLRTVDIDDDEVSAAVLADPSLPLPNAPANHDDDDDDEDNLPTLVRRFTDQSPVGRLLATQAQGPVPASVQAQSPSPEPASADRRFRPGAPVRPAALPGTERSSWEEWSPADRSGPAKPPSQRPPPAAPAGPREIRLTGGQLLQLMLAQVALTLAALALFKWVL